MHTNNLEARRFWQHPKFAYWNFDPEFDSDVVPACAACGMRTFLGDWRGEWFCGDCIEHATQSQLDSDYDDLGVAG